VIIAKMLSPAKQKKLEFKFTFIKNKNDIQIKRETLIQSTFLVRMYLLHIQSNHRLDSLHTVTIALKARTHLNNFHSTFVLQPTTPTLLAVLI